MAEKKTGIKFEKKQFLESTILGIAGLIAFSIITVIVYIFGLILGVKSLRYGFLEEVLLIKNYPLFFTLVAIVKILIGGELIYITTKFISKILKMEILADKKKIKRV
ncbi:MAG: hypothetical protein HYT71_03845 [Candidatus Aenigmarchaeota archaeon]|nr:hypothetical protein [Candidatus Aenigmarchaeota archaeon]